MAQFGVKEMEALLSETQPVIASAFIDAVKYMRNKFTIKRITALVSEAKWEEALDQIEEGFEDIPKVYRRRVLVAGNKAAKFLGDNLNVVVDFDAKNYYALGEMNDADLRLIRQFTDSQRDITRKALFDSMDEGFNPIKSARAFRDSIGLTDYQMGIVNNYRRNLEELDFNATTRELRDRRFDRTVNRAIRDGVPLDPKYIDKLVERYHERFVKYRSQTIARTESLRSVHQGVDLMWHQAVEQGQVKQEELIQTWVATHDGRTRDTHSSMDGQKRAYGEKFVSPSGDFLRFPCDPNASAKETINCRCIVTTEVDIDKDTSQPIKDDEFVDDSEFNYE